MDKSIKFRIQLETNGQKVLHTMGVEAEDFRAAVEQAVDETKRLKGTVDNLAQSGLQFMAIKDLVTTLQGAVSGLADEFNRFDAAAIKAAGGMKQFLQQLTKDVGQYAQTTSPSGPLGPDASPFAPPLAQVRSSGASLNCCTHH